MEYLLNASSIDMPITDVLPKKKKLNRDGQVKEAEVKMHYHSPLSGWVPGQVLHFAGVGLSPEQKRALGAKSKLIKAPALVG